MNFDRNSINRIAIIFVMVCVGCSGSKTVNEKTTQLDSTAPLSESTNAKSTAEKLNTELERLTNKAKLLEAEFRFEEAGKIWHTIYQQLLTKYGKDAWQVKNAKAVGHLAFKKATLSAAQLRQLKKEQPLQDKINAQLRANDLPGSLKTADSLLKLQEEVLGEDAISVGQTLLQLGSIEHQAGSSESAIRHLHRGIRVLERAGLDDHPEIEIGHTMLGALYAEKQKFAPAIENQKVATRISSRVWGESSLQYADQANQLGVVYQQSGNLNIALKILHAAEAIRRLKLGPDDPAVAHSQLNIGIVARQLRLYDDAEQSLLSAKNIFIKNRAGELESYIARCNSNLATLYMITNKPQLAEPLLLELVQSVENSESRDAGLLASYRYRYCIALARQGKYDEAQPLMELTLKQQQEILGAAHADTIQTMNAYALLLKTTRQTEAAEKIYNQIRQVSFESDDNNFRR